MPSAPAVAGIVVGLVFILLGVINLPTCNGGLSLILFGAGMLAIAAGSIFVGGVPVAVGAGIFGVALIVAGVIVQGGASAGCTFML